MNYCLVGLAYDGTISSALVIDEDIRHPSVPLSISVVKFIRTCLQDFLSIRLVVLTEYVVTIGQPLQIIIK